MINPYLPEGCQTFGQAIAEPSMPLGKRDAQPSVPHITDPGNLQHLRPVGGGFPLEVLCAHSIARASRIDALLSSMKIAESTFLASLACMLTISGGGVSVTFVRYFSIFNPGNWGLND